MDLNDIIKPYADTIDAAYDALNAIAAELSKEWLNNEKLSEQSITRFSDAAELLKSRIDNAVSQ